MAGDKFSTQLNFLIADNTHQPQPRKPTTGHPLELDS